MTWAADAVVIDFVAARARRGLARARGADVRKRWLAELATWPAVFRRRVGPLVAKNEDLDGTLGADRMEALSARALGRLVDDLVEIHSRARSLREARRRGHRGWITRRQHELDAAKAWLLERLFGLGMRSVDRSAARFAREAIYAVERATLARSLVQDAARRARRKARPWVAR